MTNDDSSTPRLIPFSGLKTLGITHSRWTLRELERRGVFPRRVRLSPRKSAWLESDIQKFLADAIAARDNSQSTPKR